MVNAPKVTIAIPTQNRYDALALTLWGIHNQTYGNWDVVIIDDSDDDVKMDLREHPLVGQILRVMWDAGQLWTVLDGKRKGPHHSHQISIEWTKNPYIWRIDDDEVAQPHTLQTLMDIMLKEKCGAVGPLVLLPEVPALGSIPKIAGKIGYADFNLQNHRFPGEMVEVEHLHSSYLYDVEKAREVGGFYLGYSRVGHREETDFSYRLHKAGHKLFVTPKTEVMHFRLETGGIRSNNPNQALWEADDQVFWSRVRMWNADTLFIPIFCGIGDHIAATAMIRGLQKQGKKVIVGASVPMILPEDIEQWDLRIVDKLSDKPSTPYAHNKGDTLIERWCSMYGVEPEPMEVAIEAVDLPDNTVLLFKETKRYKKWETSKWKALQRKLEKKGFNVQDTIGMSLPQVMGAIYECEFFVSIDSFAGHAGDALHKQGIILWGETDSAIFGYNTNVNIAQAEPNPDVQWLINDNLDNEKMRNIEVEDVMLAVNQL